MAQYRERKYTVWPNPEKLVQDIKSDFQLGNYSVEIIYNDTDNSITVRTWDTPAYNIADHALIPDLD